VRRELDYLDPSLSIMNALGEVNVEKRREFKKRRNITSVTMNVLIAQPGDAFFAKAKKLKGKNKLASEISLYAVEFFKVFLKQKSNFEQHLAVAYYRPYNIATDKHSNWQGQVWTKNMSAAIKFGLFDFRYTPVVLNKDKCTLVKPYFQAALKSFKEMKKPRLEDIPAWLFICSDLVEQTQALAYL